MIAGNITIKSENTEYGIETNADSVFMDANNNQKSAFNAKPYITSSGVKSYLSGLSSDIPFYFCYKAFDKSDNEISLQNTNKKYGTSGADVVSDSPYEISIEDSELSGKVSYLKLLLSVNNSIVYTKIIYLNRDLPIAFSRSEVWSSGLTFNNGNLIISDNVVYQWNYPHAGNSAVNPTTDITNNPTTTHWVAYQQWTLLATKIIMAAFALLGGAVFSGDYMYSQQGKDASGNATSNYTLFDASKLGTSNCPFTPNLYFNYKTGDTYQANGTFSGIVKANLFYNSFKNITSADFYALNPAIDGCSISLGGDTDSMGHGYNSNLLLPSAQSWDGLHVLVYVANFFSSTKSIIKTTDGFVFPHNRIPISDVLDTSLLIHPERGLYEFISVKGKWLINNYNLTIGPLVHTGIKDDSSYTLYLTDITTYASFYNSINKLVYLPANPIPFREIKLYRGGDGSVTINGNGKQILAAGTLQNSVVMAHQSEMDTVVYNGVNWDYSFGNYN